MTKTFTRNDVLRYYYNEVSKLEKNEIEEFLAGDDLLMDYYCSLLAFEQQVERAQAKPKKSTVRNILAYSKSLCLQN